MSNEETYIESGDLRQFETIKLSRGMTGKYGWEIKLVKKDNVETELKRLDKINKELLEKYDYGISTE